MQRGRNILLLINVIAVVCFVVVMFSAKSDAAIWRAFSVTMPIIGLSFFGAVILTVLNYIRRNRK